MITLPLKGHKMKRHHWPRPESRRMSAPHVLSRRRQAAKKGTVPVKYWAKSVVIVAQPENCRPHMSRVIGGKQYKLQVWLGGEASWFSCSNALGACLSSRADNGQVDFDIIFPFVLAMLRIRKVSDFGPAFCLFYYLSKCKT